MMNKKAIILILALCLVVGTTVWAYKTLLGSFGVERSLAEYAHVMVEKCADATYRPTCYEEEVPKLVEVLPSERIFDVVRLIRTEDPEYLYCHVLAHELGSYEVSLDPDNWLDVVAKGPTDGMCSNGFAHGAIVTRFSDEDLSPEEYRYALEDLAIACEEREGWNPTELTKAICYHGVGHVLIHMTLANVAESLEGCEFIGLKEDGRDYRQLCTEGVYMQLFQPLEPEDYALIDMLPYAPNKDNLKKFCEDNSATDAQYGACWREAWPLLGVDAYTASGVTTLCGGLTEAQEKDRCFTALFTIVGRHNLGEPEKIVDTCNGMSPAYQGQCFANGANSFLEEDPNFVPQGVALCGEAATEAAKDECFSFLAQVASFNFHPGSEPFEVLCSSVPLAYQKACRGG